MWKRRMCLVNGHVVADGHVGHSVRFSTRVLAIDSRPHAGDLVIDLDGAYVLPGLINAHDHLELNHYGARKFRERYANASEWIEDMRPRLRADPEIVAGQRHPLSVRLLAGGVKNLFAGVTTVAHHNPYYRELATAFPVRVLRRYGWAHSFLLQNRPAGAGGEVGGTIRDRYAATPADVPFFLHLAEGTDAQAEDELAQLEALHSLGANTVLIHGVAISPDGWRRMVEAGAALVWCPASNVFLFGRSAPIRAFMAEVPGSASRIAIGTDSRLSGSRDLLDELRAARTVSSLAAETLLSMVTANASTLLRLPASGRIAPGVPADLIVVPRLADQPADALLQAHRSDIALVVIDGRPLVARPDLEDLFGARRVAWQPLRVDGVEKIVDERIVQRLRRSPIEEPGVTWEPAA